MTAARFDACLVIPVHDEGERLARLLEELVAIGRGRPPLEVRVVDDGSAPEALAIHAAAVDAANRAIAAAGAPHRAVLVSLPDNVGKGAAVRRGWADADAPWMGFVDGDGSVGAAEIWRLVEIARAEPVDAVVGARSPLRGPAVRRGRFRALQGAVFARAARSLLALGVSDPQCGAKVFRRDALAPILPRLRERRWLLDVELLRALRDRGATVKEVPIAWSDRGNSNVVPVVDALRMLAGLVVQRARRVRGEGSRRLEGYLALAVAVLLALTTWGAAALAASGRRYANPSAFAVERPSDAYAVWREAGVRGRILVHFDRRLFTDVIPIATPLSALEEHLADGSNYLRAAILTGKVREILHVVPDDAWTDIEQHMVKRAAVSAIVVQDGRRYRTVVWSVPVTITRARDLPHLEEPVLLDVDEALFSRDDAARSVPWDLLVAYRRSATPARAGDGG